MRRIIMKKAICLTLLSLCVMGTSALYAQQREVEPVEFRKISDGLYEIVGGRGARGGAYIGDNGVLVIDAKMDESSVTQVMDGIRQMTDKPITYLVNTHSDGDHVWGNQFFPETVTIVAHENCRNEFFHTKRDGSPSDWNNPDLASFLPSLTFTNRMDIYLGSKKVELWHFGTGHTTGDAVVFFPEEKTAFVGDQIFLERIQLIHSYKGGNSFAHVKTLTKMLETLDAEHFCSGHSEMTDRDGIQNHIIQMKNRQEKVKELVAQGKTPEEVKSAFQEDEARLVSSIYEEVKSME